jgi:hypothetical protein
MYKRENFGCGCRSSESYKEYDTCNEENFKRENFQCGCGFKKSKRNEQFIYEDYKVKPVNSCRNKK